MIEREKLRNKILKLGADLCGFAPIGRFENAPEGFRPIDIFKECKTVVVFAKKVPHGSLFSNSCVPYTHVNDLITQEIDFLTMEITRLFEKLKITCVPIPSDDPYEYWLPAKKYGRAILSLKHAGYNAGLGVMGKNTLLINEKYGNMIQLGAILINQRVEEDPIAQYEGCIDECRICLENCPQMALDGKTVNQKLCRPLSNYKTEKGYNLKKCYLCRKLCPNALGVKTQTKLNQ
ncbi:MAG: epoxyqueuosine reductase [Candidatus Lokiarchaeota archaeon]|nr:epoxyqueuosine reductase [Candidatus Lokiarchaeota archaeon]